MKKNHVLGSLVLFFALIVALFGSVSTVQASNCEAEVSLQQLNNQNQLIDQGFQFDLIGPAEVNFANQGELHYGLFNLHSILSSSYAAARLSETCNKRWSMAEGIDATWDFRYNRIPSAPYMTDNFLLWNNPFSGDPNGGREASPVTAFGMARNIGTGYNYSAVAIVNLDTTTFQSDMFVIVPVAVVAPWLDPNSFHRVNVQLTETSVRISVIQNGQEAVLINAPLPPNSSQNLAYVLSTDNEVLPGFLVPPSESGFDVSSIVIHSGE